jgi:hypothetical protein
VKAQALLMQVLRAPDRMAGLDAPEWDLLLRQAGAANLGASLCLLAEEHGLLGGLPAPARAAARLGAQRLANATARPCVSNSASSAGAGGTGLPLILLKGRPIRWPGCRPGAGRLFSDIDILVPKERLAEVESGSDAARLGFGSPRRL